ncbi:gliding motility-associated C-terminal domain-containing protein [Rufibacter immobilis]|uniref:Gliding motility-associated C-terminal domain-containing protein n=1 Tax=Rufibacter immobilis TaxID=1348778 RepID=A0A3M9MP66_9BACT|nr:gliding motility-associated C-terminal domain-containing protein [Rufibacter immobilis]RNI27330.1 gliding motility-associated C-terminal domain-containing protein [Rufibacter immobilis]
MHSFKSYLLLLALYLYSSSFFLYGQTQASCNAAITPPPSGTLCYGTPLTATTGATGNVFYRWQKDGEDIFGANQKTYSLTSSGSYRVIVQSTSCATDTSDAVTVTVSEQEASFTADQKERIQPQSADTCGIPVRVELKNESKPEGSGSGLTYTWEVTRQDGKTPLFKFLDGTNANSFEPVLQFNEKGQYTVKLKIQGPCNPNGEEGPDDPADPENPDTQKDGRYVHEEQVLIVYPQVTPNNIEECEDLTAPPYTVRGSSLATFDANLGTIDPTSIIWTVPPGVTISDIQAEDPEITFPTRSGSYEIKVTFRNECESVLEPGVITVNFNPRPPTPVLPKAEEFVCSGITYTISPSPSSSTKLYNFYRTPTGGTALNTGGPAPIYTVGPLSSRSVYYIAAFENGCESLERAMFTLNIIQEDLENTIAADQTICADTKPASLSGSNARVGNSNPSYLWVSRTDSSPIYAAASTQAGRNDQQTYSPPVLTETTYFRRLVIFPNCPNPDSSNIVTVEVLPIIDPSTNVIEADKPVVCKGEVPTLTGNLLSGDIEYLWESSTTSATAGFIPAVPAEGSDNTNGASFTPRFITQTTWYRRTAKYRNTNCAPVPSAEAIEITIDELPPVPIVKAAAVTTCENSSAVLEVVPVTGGTATLTYVWYTEATGGDPIGSGSPFNTPPLTSDATFYVEAQNENECISTRRTAVRVTVSPISANAGNDTTIIQGQSVTLRGSGGGANATFTWSPADGLSNPNIANPVATPAGNTTATTTVTYTLTVSNGAECEAIDEVTITVIPRITVFNTFSPNRDGINETWEIPNIQNYPEATVEIFNRYGAPVYKSSGYSQPWDGTHNGNPLPLATYYYIIRLNKNEKPFTGSVTLIR